VSEQFRSVVGAKNLASGRCCLLRLRHDSLRAQAGTSEQSRLRSRDLVAIPCFDPGKRSLIDTFAIDRSYLATTCSLPSRFLSGFISCRPRYEISIVKCFALSLFSHSVSITRRLCRFFFHDALCAHETFVECLTWRLPRLCCSPPRQ
jgi:hypothetical protein